jgi:hypothetical protein
VTTADLDRQARAYARRMRTDKSLALEVPEEWDFRAITQAELPIAIEYEYMRENTAFREGVTAWLETKIKGKSVRSLILTKEDYYPFEHAHCSLDVMGRWLAQDFPLFPSPWLAYERADLKAYCAGRAQWTSTNKSVFVCPAHGVNPGFLLTSADKNQWHLLRLDLPGRTTKDILRDFGSWLRKEAKKHKRLSGKASAEPWQKLKWLSARRLANAGLKYPSNENPGVNGFISQRMKAAPGNYENDVLPLYASSGAWYDALSMAEAELAQP